jgi:hypothetical protein
MVWIVFTVLALTACSPLHAVAAPLRHHRPHHAGATPLHGSTEAAPTTASAVAGTEALPREGTARAGPAGRSNPDGPPWRALPGGGRYRQRRSGGRCAGAVGPWCGPFYEQRLVPFKTPRPRGAACPGNCSGVGVCHGDTGRCDCPAGARGGGDMPSLCPLPRSCRPPAAVGSSKPCQPGRLDQLKQRCQGPKPRAPISISMPSTRGPPTPQNPIASQVGAAPPAQSPTSGRAPTASGCPATARSPRATLGRTKGTRTGRPRG